MADAPALRAYIDQYLTDDLGIELEDQIISGSGAGENLTGIFNTTGTQTAGPPGAGESMFDVLREAKRLVEVGARTTPTAAAFNPADAETLDLLKKNAEVNNFVADPYAPSAQRSVWGMAVVISDAVPAGFALVGDFRQAVLFDREAATVSIGTVDDDFIRNIVRVLGELRAGFAVARPAAFVEVDLVA